MQSLIALRPVRPGRLVGAAFAAAACVAAVWALGRAVPGENWWLAVVLGLVEGMAEFIPVSSTGHLLLAGEVFGFSGPPGHTFEIAIQLGAILAVCVAYRERVAGTLLGAFSDRRARNFAAIIMLATLPAMAVGALAHGFIKDVLFSPLVVAVMLILGGVAMLLIEKRLPAPRVAEVDDITPGLALKIGLCQCVAMIPGVSRSGATIMGALLLGTSRKAAAEFSFFLAIPTMAAATAYDLWKNRAHLAGDDMLLILVGFLAAFLSALAVVRWVVAFVSRRGFAPFAWYRIVVGSAALAALLLLG